MFSGVALRLSRGRLHNITAVFVWWLAGRTYFYIAFVCLVAELLRLQLYRVL